MGLILMKWSEVRRTYPDQFVKVQILQSHIKDNKKYVDEVAVIKPLKEGKEATSELPPYFCLGWG